MSRVAPLIFALAFAACSSDPTVVSEGAPADLDDCAHVVDVAVSRSGDTYSFVVTVRSTDTGWDKYTDAWEVRSPDGEVLAVRELLHPHVDEQPFTRSLSQADVPEGTTVVTIAARDSVRGFCGHTMDVALPGRS